MSIGWISLHRKIQENDLWFSEPFTKGQAWVDLLLLANHKPKTIFKRGIKITINRGEIGWSEEKLAARWQWSRGKVRRFLKYLKTVQQIEQQNNYTLSRIIIKNYEKYQINGTADGTNNNNVNKENNISEQSSANSNMFNCKPDDEYEENFVDYNSTGETVSLKEKEKEQKATVRAERNKQRAAINKIFTAFGVPKPDPKQMNWHLKHYQMLLDRGWSHPAIGQELINTLSSDLWKKKMENGEYPGMNTVEFSLRNKKPK